ncbi:hypothetical protein ACIRPN_25430 [Streptomyces sp. NPDC101230]|uniref:hypothetical protein n=1 Tax=unclassified Streptomyces TaxID=2593676 RepID=UPI0038092915
MIDPELRRQLTDEEQAAPRAAVFLRGLNQRLTIAAVPDLQSYEVIRQVEATPWSRALVASSNERTVLLFAKGGKVLLGVFDGVAYRVHRQGPSSRRRRPWVRAK